MSSLELVQDLGFGFRVAYARFCFSLPAMTIAATGFSLLTTSHGSPYWSTPNRQLVPTQLATAIATARATVAGSLALSLAGICLLYTSPSPRD